jgi:hypothetical protein
MRRFVYSLALAMTLPAIMWHPRPARAATVDAAIVLETGSAAATIR